MANRWGNNGNWDRLYFGGSKMTADGDCSHEIKSCLLLGGKAVTNLDSMLKSRDITLFTEVHLVMYWFESWTIKKVELDSFELWCWRRLLNAGEEGDDRVWECWMVSSTLWTWVWASSKSWWWTGKPGILQSIGSQSVGHDWVTGLKWTELKSINGPYSKNRCSRKN